MSTGLKANSDGSAAIQVGGTDVITLTSGGAATFVTSPTTVQAGTAAAPSITFSGDTNTGIYSPGADQVAIATGGSQRATVDSSGNFIAAAGSQNLGSTAARWGSVYATEFADGTNQLVGSASVQARFGFGSAWTSLAFATSGTERARFNNTGAFVLAGGDTSANGIGITFPATQSASTNANTLDDYEEGTFTPTLASGFSVAPTSYLLQNGRYTKIGRIVYIEVDIDPNGATANATQIRIGGMPFTVLNASPYGGAYIIFQNSFNTNTGDVYIFAENTTQLHVNTNAGSPRDGNNAGVNINNRLIFCGWYTVA